MAEQFAVDVTVKLSRIIRASSPEEAVRLTLAQAGLAERPVLDSKVVAYHRCPDCGIRAHEAPDGFLECSNQSSCGWVETDGIGTDGSYLAGRPRM